MDREVSLEIAQEQSSIEGILTKEEKKQLKKEAIKELQKTENQDGEKPLIKVELTKEEKVSIFFDRIDFLSLDDDGKERVAVDVKTQAVGDNLYWIEVVLSAVIATLGLLQNSVAVIIGAMLITPLLRPINGVAFSIANGGTKFYFKALKVLFYSILVSMFIGYVVSLIAGVASENQEILSRTSPNIMDFFIAIFSAVIAVLSLRYSRLGESIAGVAMAASLMPPLAVIGIQLAEMNYSLVIGAFLLFFTNLISIIMVGTFFFWLYGFSPHIEKRQKFMIHIVIGVATMIILILFPLYHSFTLKQEENLVIRQLQMIQKEIGKDIDGFEMTDIVVKEIQAQKISINTTVRIPEGYDVSGLIQTIQEKLETGKHIELDVDIIRGYSIDF